MERNGPSIEKLLALILLETMRDATVKEKAVRLKVAGFSNTDIGGLLQTSRQVINQLLYQARATRRGYGRTRAKTGKIKRKKSIEK